MCGRNLGPKAINGITVVGGIDRHHFSQAANRTGIRGLFFRGNHTVHGFRIGLAQVGSGQINGHHELQFESAPQVVQKGEVALEAKAIHGQLSRQWSDVTSAFHLRGGHRVSATRGVALRRMP